MELTKQNVPFQWTKLCQIAFDELKRELTSAGLVAHPTDEGQFILDTDASAKTIGCVLSQVQDGKERVIAYGSRTLSRTEQNYCVTDRELLAVRYFMEYYRQYLLGRKFLVRTDHQAIRWLFSLKDPKDRLARGLEILSTYTFTIEYRPGKKNGNADAMSQRRCNPMDCQCPLLDGNEEILIPCGPCRKCSHRAHSMDSSPMGRDGAVVPKEVTVSTQNGPIVTCSIGTQVDLIKVTKEMPIHTKTFRGRRCGRTARKRGQNQAASGLEPHSQVCAIVCRQTTVDRSTYTEMENESWLLPESAEELRQKQRADVDIAPIIKWLEEGKRPSGSEVAWTSQTTRHYWLYWNSLILENGVLFRCHRPKMGMEEVK